MDHRCVIAGKPEGTRLEAGKVYEVRHERKGAFVVRVDEVGPHSATVTILDGIAKAVMRYNVREEGDALLLGYNMTYWIPVNKTPDQVLQEVNDRTRVAIDSVWKHKGNGRRCVVKDVREVRATDGQVTLVTYRYTQLPVAFSGNISRRRNTQELTLEKFLATFKREDAP